jgi:hypothetical protein
MFIIKIQRDLAARPRLWPIRDPVAMRRCKSRPSVIRQKDFPSADH